MADTSTPKAFLEEALSLVDSLTEDKSSLERSKTKKQQIEKAIETLKKNIEREKTTTVEGRRRDIEKEYDKNIKKAESEIEHITSRRTKARDEMVKKRVVEQTAGLKKRKETLIEEFHAYCKTEKVPAICRTKLYYKLYSPSRFGDWLLLLILAALMIGALAIAFHIHDWKIFVVVVVCEVVLLLLYARVWSVTKGKHPEQIRVCKAKLKEIRECDGNIRSESKSIHKDKTDEFYDLAGYDTELSAKNQEKLDIEAQKTQALYQFDNMTRQQILTEIDTNYAERLNENAASLQAAAAELSEISQRVLDGEKRVNAELVPYIGSRNLTHEAIEKMIMLVESGEAVSISDAVSKANS